MWGAWIEMLPPQRQPVPCGWSPPVWGAWIEILKLVPDNTLPVGRPPCGGRGLKSVDFCVAGVYNTSPPVWGAWIEILHRPADLLRGLAVAPRVGGVD